MSVTELIGAAIANTLIAIGGTSLAAWNLHRRASDRVLVSFGLWCCLYGIRLAAEQEFIRTTLGAPMTFWVGLTSFVTYTINVPIGWFFEALFGAGWKQSIRRVWQLQAVYAAGAIAVDLALRRPGASMPLNSPIVLAGLCVALVNGWLYRDRLNPLFKTRSIAIGAAIMVLAVANENLRRPIVPSVDLEPVGVFAFILCLGYSVVASVFRNEAELAAVQRDLETARQIQASLLPRELPGVRSVDLSVRYLPMTAVAGDLYDFALLGPARIGILVADVSGHGVPAALIASMVKLAFTSQAAHADDPAKVLAAMNQILCRHMEKTFVTAVYAVIDTERRTMTFANAGHPPVLISRRSGVEESQEHGCVLGFLPEAAYVNGLLSLHEGDRVLLYTDGVPEAQNQRGEFLDREGLTRWLAGGDGTASGFADEVLRRLRSWRGQSTFDDDVTFVVVDFAA
jgi:phosphoserine phosphatase RsbU/P